MKPRSFLVASGYGRNIRRHLRACFRAGLPAMCLECDAILEWSPGTPLEQSVDEATRHVRACRLAADSATPDRH